MICGLFTSILKGAGNKVGSINAPEVRREKKRLSGTFGRKEVLPVRVEGDLGINIRTLPDISNVERRAALPAARRGPWADNNNMLDRRLRLYLVGDSLGHHTHDHNQVSTDS